MLRTYERCRQELDTLRRVSGPAGTLMGLSAAALAIGGLLAGLSGAWRN